MYFSIQYLGILFYSIFLISHLLLQLFFNFNFSYFIIIERINIRNKLNNNTWRRMRIIYYTSFFET